MKKIKEENIKALKYEAKKIKDEISLLKRSNRNDQDQLLSAPPESYISAD